MKRLSTIPFALLFIVISTSALQAQHIDRGRMNRDLAIMKSVLNELFKSTWADTSQPGSTTTPPGNSSANQFYTIINLGNSHRITATFIPDYGVLFNINGIDNPFVFTVNTQEQAFFAGTSGNGESKTPITKQSVLHRIKLFLEGYAASIHQLTSDDRITVIFNGNPDYNSQRNLPSVAVSAQMGDLKAYRRGDITKKELTSRLSISGLKNPAADNQRLNIFAGILKSAFQNNQTISFQFGNDLHYFRLKNVGVLFEGDISTGWGPFSNAQVPFFNFSHHLAKKINHFINFDSIYVHVDSNQVDGKTLHPSPPRIKTFSYKISTNDQDNQKRQQKLRDALSDFITTLKETVLDYGNTLKSLDPDESIIISANVADGRTALPDNIYLQVHKSVLTAYARGNLSREQALDKIKVSKN